MKARITCNQEVYTAVAKELGITIAEVKEIYDSQSKFIKQTMESNTFDGVRWPYLGVIKSKPEEIMIMSHMKGLTTKEQRMEFIRSIKAKSKQKRLEKELNEQTNETNS
jgi:DNA-binding transcriptional MerR regulator